MGALVPKSRALAFLGGIVSHIFLDLVPHWDYRTAWAGAISTALSFLTLAVLARRSNKVTIFWGGLGGMLPDLEVALAFFGLIRSDQMVFPTHTFLPHPQASFFISAPLQILFSLGLFLLLWKGWPSLSARQEEKLA